MQHSFARKGGGGGTMHRSCICGSMALLFLDFQNLSFPCNLYSCFADIKKRLAEVSVFEEEKAGQHPGLCTPPFPRFHWQRSVRIAQHSTFRSKSEHRRWAPGQGCTARGTASFTSLLQKPSKKSSGLLFSTCCLSASM